MLLFGEGSNLTFLEEIIFAHSSITSFQIPEKVSIVHGYAFTDRQLTSISVHPKNNYLTTNGNAVFSKNESILFFICNKIGYEIPNSVTAIGEYCFYQSSIQTIIVPVNVKKIEGYVFSSCNSLINVTFLGPIDYFGDRVFDDCSNLELIIFPNSPMTVQ